MTSCDQRLQYLLASVPDLDSFAFLAPMSFLVVFNLIVITGNSLVIIAVLTQEKLRTVTNTFVVSLAAADLLLGLTVLPFSSAKEVLHYWPFGGVWCSVWLAVDVWLCTSSILNLCAISFDRYLAIGFSFEYPRWMSPLRAKLLVAGVWVLSFIICSPPLIGWNERKQPFSEVTTVEMTSLHYLNFHKVDTISSSVAADAAYTVHVSEPSVDRIMDYNHVHDPEDTGAESDILSLTNWMKNDSCKTLPTCVLSSNSGYVIYSACGSFWIPMCVMAFFYWRVYVTARQASMSLRRGVIVTGSESKVNALTSATGSGGIISVALRVHRGGMTSVVSSPILKVLRSVDDNEEEEDMGREGDGSSPRMQRSKQSAAQKSSVLAGSSPSQTKHQGSGDGDTAAAAHGFGVRGRNYVNRLRKEQKAAKTIGMIVGCFIACWAPFFTVYLLGAFCDSCTHAMVFTVFFWLGYGNSALNPFIYALYSRDFRIAFQRILACGFINQRASYSSSAGNGRADRLIMMAHLANTPPRPPDGRKRPWIGGPAINRPSTAYMLRR